MDILVRFKVVKIFDIFFLTLITHTNNNQLYLINILRISLNMGSKSFQG